MKRNLQSFWAVPVPELLGALQTATEGLSEEEVERRLKQYGSSLLKPRKRTDTLTLLLVQFKSPSANFGNMFSMAGASLFLPLLPKQILLTNLLTDFPEMTIATDRVDTEWVERPRCWNIRFIRNFMLTFGTLSSVFDYLTFGVLLFLLKATTDQFRTGWFVESVVSASVIVLVIRMRRPFFKSRPGRYLLIATLLIVAVTLILPFTPLGRLFGFTRLSALFLLFVGVIVLFYIVGAELAKAAFYKKARF